MMIMIMTYHDDVLVSVAVILLLWFLVAVEVVVVFVVVAVVVAVMVTFKFLMLGRKQIADNQFQHLGSLTLGLPLLCRQETSN